MVFREGRDPGQKGAVSVKRTSVDFWRDMGSPQVKVPQTEVSLDLLYDFCLKNPYLSFVHNKGKLRPKLFVGKL